MKQNEYYLFDLHAVYPIQLYKVYVCVCVIRFRAGAVFFFLLISSIAVTCRPKIYSAMLHPLSAISFFFLVMLALLSCELKWKIEYELHLANKSYGARTYNKQNIAIRET